MQPQMWRRYGDAVYTLLTLGIFGFETIVLACLSVAFLLGPTTGIASTPVEYILLAVVTSTASALALLGLYLLGYHFVSAMRDRRHGGQLDKWTESWIALALDDPAAPAAGHGTPRRLPRAARDSVLSLLEAVKGEEGDRLKEVLASHGVDRWFLRRARHGHLTARLDAIEGLGKARLPHTLDDLLELFRHPRQVVRRMAARAAAGTLTAMPPEPARTAPMRGSSPPCAAPTSRPGWSRSPCCCWRPGPDRPPRAAGRPRPVRHAALGGA